MVGRSDRALLLRRSRGRRSFGAREGDGLPSGPRPGRVSGEALGAAAPVDHLGLVELETRVVGRGQARHGTDRAVDVDHPAARAADQVVVVVAGPTLVPRRRPGGLDAPDEAPVGQDAEGVVHRLAGDDADLGPHGPGDVVRRAVRSTGHRRQNGQSLRRDLDTVATWREIGRVSYMVLSISPIVDCVKYLGRNSSFVPRRFRCQAPRARLRTVPARGTRGPPPVRSSPAVARWPTGGAVTPALGCAGRTRPTPGIAQTFAAVVGAAALLIGARCDCAVVCRDERRGRGGCTRRAGRLEPREILEARARAAVAPGAIVLLAAPALTRAVGGSPPLPPRSRSGALGGRDARASCFLTVPAVRAGL